MSRDRINEVLQIRGSYIHFESYEQPVFLLNGSDIGTVESAKDVHVAFGARVSKRLSTRGSLFLHAITSGCSYHAEQDVVFLIFEKQRQSFVITNMFVEGTVHLPFYCKEVTVINSSIGALEFLTFGYVYVKEGAKINSIINGIRK